MSSIHVLLVDAGTLSAKNVAAQLQAEGFDVTSSISGRESLEILERESIDVVVYDAATTDVDSLEAISKVKHLGLELPFIILSSNGSIPQAVEAVKQGAFDFISGADGLPDLETAIRKAVKEKSLKAEIQTLPDEEARLKQLEQKTLSLGMANVDMLAIQEQLEKKNSQMESLLVELTRSKDELQAIFDTSPSAILKINTENIVTAANERVRDFFGVTREEILNIPFDDFLKKIEPCFEDFGQFIQYQKEMEIYCDECDVSEFDLHSIYQFSVKISTPTARSILPVTANVRSAKDEHQGRIWIYEDITQAKQADELLHTIAEASPIPFIVTNHTDGEIIYVNEPLAALIGYTPDELIGKSAPDFYANSNDRRKILKKLNDSGFAYNQEVQIKRADGAIIWMIFSLVITQLGNDKVIIGGLYDIDERRRAEEALRESEERFRQLTENISEAFWIYDIEIGRIIYVSPAYESISGLKREVVLENFEKGLDIIHPDDRERILSAHDKKKSGEFDEEYRVIKPDGDVRWIRERAFPILNEQGKLYRICGVTEDFTDRKTAEEELKQERNFVSTVLETAGALVVVMDPQGRIVRFNRACEETTGYTFTEVKDKHFWDIFLIPEEVDSVKKVFHELRSGHFPNDGENYWQTKAGEKRLIAWSNTASLDNNGDVEHIIGTGIDITERKKAEENLRLYRKIFMNSNDTIAIMDNEFKLLEVNPAAKELFGYEEDELIGRSTALLTGEETFNSLVENLPEKGNYSIRREISVKTKSGDEVVVELSAFPILNANDEIIYRVGFTRDITERKRAEEAIQKAKHELEVRVKERTEELATANQELQKAQEELEIRVEKRTAQLAATNQDLRETQAQLIQSEKMAALGTLVAGIAHEINTPVGAINSMHNTLVRAIEKLKQICEADFPDALTENRKLVSTLKVIEDANRVIASGSERVTTIVKRLRSFARLDEAELKEASIEEGIEDTLVLIHHEIKHHINLEKDYGELPLISCYPGKLNQVFLNLLINAKQAVGEDGTIKIATRHEAQNVIISIADNGVGIPEENLQRIFDPGFTTKGVGVGTGLGLSIVYQIIREDHRGDITVKSKIGEGTTFTISLPDNLDEIIEHT